MAHAMLIAGQDQEVMIQLNSATRRLTLHHMFPALIVREVAPVQHNTDASILNQRKPFLLSHPICRAAYRSDLASVRLSSLVGN